jgi:hypothetical protein
MRRPMSLETKRELTVAISERYRAADRKSKKVILNEFAKVTGYHRKHAIRVLRKVSLWSSESWLANESIRRRLRNR